MAQKHSSLGLLLAAASNDCMLHRDGQATEELFRIHAEYMTVKAAFAVAHRTSKVHCSDHGCSTNETLPIMGDYRTFLWLLEV